MAEEKRAVILFADIQKSTEFGFTQPVERYNAMLREFHTLVRRVVDTYAKENGLDNARLMKGVKGDECCLFFLNGKPGQDELHAINLAIRLKEEWKASDFSKRTRAAAEVNLYPLVDLRIGIGAGHIMMQYDDWADRDTPEGIAISEAKRIEGMADGAENSLIMVNWEVHQACARSNPELVFGDGVRLAGKGIPEGMNTPVFPLVSYDKWADIQQQVVPEPEDPWELFDRALALQNSGALDGAIASYEKAVAIKPDYHEAWNNLGSAYDDKEEYGRAIECLQKALEIKPDAHEAWYNMGLAYAHKEEYGQAIERFQRAVDINPDYHEAWDNMGVAYGDKREYDQAIRCYQKAVAINPDYHEAWYNMGVAYDDKGEYDRAIECYQKAVEIKPDYHEAWNNMGLAYWHNGDYDRAIECYQKALAIKPDDHEAWNGMGVAYDDKEEYDRAIECYHKAVAINPDYYQVWSNLGNAYADKGEYDRAIECHQKAVVIEPDSVLNWFNFACAYSLQGEAALAVEKLSRAINIDGSSHENAKNHPDFDPIRKDPAFRKLVYGEGP